MLQHGLRKFATGGSASVSALTLLLSLGCAVYGGDQQAAQLSKQSGGQFFRVAKQGDRLTLLDPDGKPYFLLGLNHIVAGGKGERDLDALAAKLTQDLTGWSFNSYGWWGDVQFARKGGLSYLYPFVDITISHGNYRRAKLKVPADTFVYPDIYDAAFREKLKGKIADVCGRLRNERNMVGYMLGDTPVIIPEQRNADFNWTYALRRLPNDAPGKREYVAWLKARYVGRGADFAKLYGFDLDDSAIGEKLAGVAPSGKGVFQDDVEYVLAMIGDYYDFICPLFRANDPNHLLLGHRLTHDQLDDRLLKAAARHLDVICVQPPYTDKFDAELYGRVCQTTGKPILIDDHQIQADGKLIKTREDAAKAYGQFYQKLYDSRIVIGYAFCQHCSIIRPEGGEKPGLCDPSGQIHPEWAKYLVPANRRLLEHFE